MAHHTILLIDYEPRSIERFRQPLADAGYTVEVATDGITGIEAFHRLNPDMVLVEAMIPKRHGFEVCQELKRTPHGRRTPVLITTGVYKGRKYRTQALHIYGCDEYIEKPIAPEMLLAVVGKFFAGGSSNAAAESRAAASAVAANEAAAPPKSATPIATEPASPRPSPPKPPITNSIVKDFTEEEIMARLDAILPGGDAIQPAPTEMPAGRTETPMSSMPLEVPDFIEMSPMNESEPQDPFAQMQAELSAELGSMSAALALDPAPVFDALPQAYPSDQVLAPSLLEALPIAEEHAAPAPEATVPIAAATPAPTAAETPGQLVNFDARRSRRNKKNAKAGAGERPAAATPPPAPVPVAAKVTPIVDARPAAAESISLPPGTLAEAELAGAAVRKGVPAWVWVALALLVVAAGYFAFTRFTSLGSEAAASAPPQETQVAERQAEPAPAQAPATTKPSDQHELVLNSIDPLPSRTAPPAPDASPPLAKATPAASTKTADTIPPHMFPVVPDKPSKNLRTAPHAAEPQTLSAPVGADEGVASVDPAPEPSAAAANAAPAVTPGALVDPEEVDTTPVSLARKVPIYSMQARQLRIQGTVIMKVLVNERGTVDDVVLVQGVSGADLNDSAMRAAKSWTYRPATKAGVPVKAWKVEQVTFKL